MEIQSMTGYGKRVSGNFKVEVRSLNSKTLEIQIKVPVYLYFYEPEIRKLVRKKFSRGRIEVFISTLQAEAIKLRINKSLAKEFYNALTSLKEELSIPGDIEIADLALQKDIFLQEEPEIELTTFREALEVALDDLKKMRIEEGKNLAGDITERIHIIREGINHIEDKRTLFIADAKRVLSEKLKHILGDTLIDDYRLIQEVAILLERSDITEELVRVKSHLKYIENVLGASDSVGKKLDFLVQELQRELNTIGSKAASTEISPVVIELKAELEKIREQVQNLQ